MSVGWQIVFTFVTGLNFWAFYRIKRLQRYVLYIVVPELAAAIVFAVYLSAVTSNELRFAGSNTGPGVANEQGQLESRFVRHEITGIRYAYLALVATSLGLQGLSVYLVIIWSRQHNSALDA